MFCWVRGFMRRRDCNTRAAPDEGRTDETPAPGRPDQRASRELGNSRATAPPCDRATARLRHGATEQCATAPRSDRATPQSDALRRDESAVRSVRFVVTVEAPA